MVSRHRSAWTADGRQLAPPPRTVSSKSYGYRLPEVAVNAVGPAHHKVFSYTPRAGCVVPAPLPK